MRKINQDELIPELTKAGIIAKEYANPRSVGTPIEFFLSTIPGGKGILIKKGEKIGLKIDTDNKFRQAVLSVHEGKRKITRVVKFNREFWSHAKPSKESLAQLAKRAFNMEIPGATVTVTTPKTIKTEVLAKPTENNENSKLKVYYQATVTASVEKASTNHFLMGMDETSHFIAILPQAVKSVAEAHKFLKPAGVGPKSKRQGEFFFTPTAKKLTDKDTIRHSVQLERNSNHHAQFGIGAKRIKDNRTQISKFIKPTYVKGLIYDKRGYRHAPVDLGDAWHKVTRNKEVNTTLSPSRRTRRYD